VLNDVVFYYQLKMINEQGFFAKGSISTLDVPYSKPSIWRKIKRLVQLDLIKVNKNGYQLKKYDTLFQFLGYNLTKENNRKGTFKIHRVPFTQCTDLKHLFAFLDIRDNLNKQTKTAYRRLLQSNQYTGQNLYCTSLSEKKQLLSNIVKNNTVQMINSNDHNKQLCDFRDAFGKQVKDKYCNPDITLSLKGVCSILGLTSCSSAYAIVKQLVKQKRVLSSRRKVFITTTSLTYKEIVAKYGYKYSLQGSMLFRNLSNKLVCIEN